MKRIIFALLIIVSLSLLTACKPKIDYPDVFDFEVALFNGEDVVGKTVTFKVNGIGSNCPFGYDLQGGHHLNFCSDYIPNAKYGDEITVKVIGVKKHVLEEWIITYEEVK